MVDQPLSDPPRLRSKSRRARAFDEPLGPPPRLARVAMWSYVATATLLWLAMFAVIYQAAFPTKSGYGAGRADFLGPWRPAWSGILFFGLLGGYAFGLSRGVARLASPSGRPAGSGACAPLILHALAGLYGSLSFLVSPFVGPSSAMESVLECGLGAAALGLFFGWALVLPTALSLRRSRVLMTFALAGPAMFIAMASFFSRL